MAAKAPAKPYKRAPHEPAGDSIGAWGTVDREALRDAHGNLHRLGRIAAATCTICTVIIDEELRRASQQDPRQVAGSGSANL